MKVLKLIAMLVLAASVHSLAQQTSLTLQSPDIADYERLSVVYGAHAEGHLSIKNVRRNSLLNLAHAQISEDSSLLSEWHPLLAKQDDYRGLDDSISRQLTSWTQNQQRKGVWNTFFTNPHYLYSVNTNPFYLRANPILHFGMGREENRTLFSNQRGLYVRGGIDQKFFFEADVLESQRIFPEYVHSFVSQFHAIPGNGFYKSYESPVLGLEDGLDYNNSTGNVAWRFSPHISGTLGYGKNFIGDGHRSLILSDFSNNYFYGRIDTRVWKLHYTNVWGQLTTGTPASVRGDNIIPPKWFAQHYLSLQISPQFRLGVFETVVFGRNEGRFDINYLIPVVFYRTIEGALGSPDNALLGADFRWDIQNRFSIYGQLLLDEFKLSELLIERRGWWANKYGIQLGAKYFDAFGIKHLSGRIETNWVRPFTYAHKDSLRSFAHYNMPMAHPLGANFVEYLMHWQYNYPGPWNAELAVFWMVQGKSDDENVGWNVIQSYNSRTRDSGFDLPEGDQYRTLLLRAQTSYEFYPCLNAYLQFIYRNQWIDGSINTSDVMASLGVTYHFHLPNHDF